jgi:hypothetical protein
MQKRRKRPMLVNGRSMFVVVVVIIIHCQVDLEFIDQAQIGSFRVLKKESQTVKMRRVNNGTRHTLLYQQQTNEFVPCRLWATSLSYSSESSNAAADLATTGCRRRPWALQNPWVRLPLRHRVVLLIYLDWNVGFLHIRSRRIVAVVGLYLWFLFAAFG